jgi:hypothetical protein
MRGQKLPIALSATALVVAVLGMTPISEATTNAVQTHFARSANFLRGKPPSVAPKPNTIVQRDGRGRIQGVTAARGPQGPPGAQGSPGAQGTTGPKGDRGDSGAPGSVPPPEAPIPAAFATGWGNWSGPEFEGVAYWKDSVGVHLRGLASKTGPAAPALGDVILTLPPGYRPAKILIFAVHTGEPNGVGRVDIAPDGTVKWISGQTGPGCCGDYTSLSNIHFRPA